MIDEPANPTEPRWLLWAREIQALAQTGLAFTRDQYDRERYQRLRALAAQIMARAYRHGDAGHRGDVHAANRLRHAEAGRAWSGVPRRPATARARDGGRAPLDAAGRVGGCEREPCRGRRQGSARGGWCSGASIQARRRVGPGSSPAWNGGALPRLAAVLPVRDHRRRACNVGRRRAKWLSSRSTSCRRSYRPGGYCFPNCGACSSTCANRICPRISTDRGIRAMSHYSQPLCSLYWFHYVSGSSSRTSRASWR